MKSTSSEALPLRRQGLFAARDPVPRTTSVQRIALRAGTRRSPLRTRTARCAFLHALPPASGPSRRDRDDRASARSATVIAVEDPARRGWRWMIGWCSTTLKPADLQLRHESDRCVLQQQRGAGRVAASRAPLQRVGVVRRSARACVGERVARRGGRVHTVSSAAAVPSPPSWWRFQSRGTTTVRWSRSIARRDVRVLVGGDVDLESDAAHRPPGRQRRCVEVDVSPVQAEHLTAAHAAAPAP
jgi:hypothetical protein